MILFHGTSERSAAEILKHGLIPRKARKAKGNWKHSIESNPNTIYLTDTYPLYFAAHCSQNSERPAVLEIDTDFLDVWNFVPDEDAVEQVSRGHDALPDHWNMVRRTRYYRDRTKNQRGSEAWRASLKAMGTCGYMDAIPSEAIRRIAYLDREKQRPTIWAAMDASISVQAYQVCKGIHGAITAFVWDRLADYVTDMNTDGANSVIGFIAQSTVDLLQKTGREGIEITR